MKTWYALAQAPNKPAVMSIMEDIGSFGVSAKAFLDDLATVSSDSVDVEINSLGGDMVAGLAIFNGLRNSGKKIKVRVLGVAASAASLVAMAGDEIEMPENTFLMLHNPWTFAAGDASEMRLTADWLDKMATSLVTTYAKRSGKTPEEVSALLDAETWLTADEAVAQGFATKVTPAFAVQASFDADRLPKTVFAALKAAADSAPDIDPEDPDANPADAPAAGDLNVADVVAAAEAATLSEYAPVLAADPSIKTPVELQARLRDIREIKALCALAKQDAMAATLIAGKKSLTEARAAVFAVLEGADENVDTTPPAGTGADDAPKAKSTTTTASLWAAYRKTTNRQ